MSLANPPRVPVTFPAKQSTMDMARELSVSATGRRRHKCRRAATACSCCRSVQGGSGTEKGKVSFIFGGKQVRSRTHISPHQFVGSTIMLPQIE